MKHFARLAGVDPQFFGGVTDGDRPNYVAPWQSLTRGSIFKYIQCMCIYIYNDN